MQDSPPHAVSCAVSGADPLQEQFCMRCPKTGGDFLRPLHSQCDRQPLGGAHATPGWWRESASVGGWAGGWEEASRGRRIRVREEKIRGRVGTTTCSPSRGCQVSSFCPFNPKVSSLSGSPCSGGLLPSPRHSTSPLHHGTLRCPPARSRRPASPLPRGSPRGAQPRPPPLCPPGQWRLRGCSGARSRPPPVRLPRVTTPWLRSPLRAQHVRPAEAGRTPPGSQWASSGGGSRAATTGSAGAWAPGAAGGVPGGAGLLPEDGNQPGC